MVAAVLQMTCSTLSLEAQGALVNVQRSLSVPSGTAVPHIAPGCAHLNVDAGFCNLPSQNCFVVSFSSHIPFISFIIGILILILGSRSTEML